MIAAGFGSLGVIVFSTIMGDQALNMTLEMKRIAFQRVILSSSIIVGVVGILVFLFLRPEQGILVDIPNNSPTNVKRNGIKAVLKYPAIWLLMVIILCAYTAYKATDLFTLYASTVMQYNDITSAKVGTSLLYIRPFIGVVIGFMADKTRPSLWLMVGFLLTIIASLVFTTNMVNYQNEGLFTINILVMALGVYSCRVLYFAILEEAKIPLTLTGTAVGLASIVGYTPDIFSGPMFGILVDNPERVVGLQNAFKVQAIFAMIGFLASFFLLKLSKDTNCPDGSSLEESVKSRSDDR